MHLRCRRALAAYLVVIPGADSFCPAVGRPHTFTASLCQHHGVPEAVSGWRRSMAGQRRPAVSEISKSVAKDMPLRMQDGPGFDRSGAGELC